VKKSLAMEDADPLPAGIPEDAENDAGTASRPERRQAVVAGKYRDGVFCNLPGVSVRYSSVPHPFRFQI